MFNPFMWWFSVFLELKECVGLEDWRQKHRSSTALGNLMFRNNHSHYKSVFAHNVYKHRNYTRISALYLNPLSTRTDFCSSCWSDCQCWNTCPPAPETRESDALTLVSSEEFFIFNLNAIKHHHHLGLLQRLLTHQVIVKNPCIMVLLSIEYVCTCVERSF